MLMMVPELGHELGLFSKIKVVACLKAGFIGACLHCGLLEHISNVIPIKVTSPSEVKIVDGA